jgi:hypothetical protein
MSPGARRAARSEYETAKKSPLGSGKRFAAVEAEAAASGAENPAAVAAAAGRKAHGQKAMTRYSKMGKRKRSK